MRTALITSISLAEGAPQDVYNDFETQKELLVEAQWSWKGCQDEFRFTNKDVRGFQEEIHAPGVEFQEEMHTSESLQARLPDVTAKSDPMKEIVAEHSSQCSASAGSNAEAGEPENKIRRAIEPFGRFAEDGVESEVVSFLQAPTRHTITEEVVVDPRAKEVDGIDVNSWPKPGDIPAWKTNLADRLSPQHRSRRWLSNGSQR